MKKPSPVLDALKKAAGTLRMPSESDAPFEPFLWSDGADLTAERLLQLAHQPKGTAVEEDTLDNLFRTVPSEQRAKFQKLQQALQGQLTGIRVFKVGDEAERDVYIAGKTPDGHWAGLKTSVVET